MTDGRDERKTDATRRGGGSHGPIAFESMGLCPACGGDLVGVKCKTVCSRCRLLVENCSGD